jgi:hypothetical protein
MQRQPMAPARPAPQGYRAVKPPAGTKPPAKR